MYYLLIIIGISLILVGLYKDKDNLLFLKNNKVESKIEFNELNHLKLRIENIENILFSTDPIITEDKESVYETAAASITNRLIEEDDELIDNSMNTYKLIRKYEKDNYSLEEICSLLEMRKGEVLLLKNLYKNYPL